MKKKQKKEPLEVLAENQVASYKLSRKLQSLGFRHSVCPNFFYWAKTKSVGWKVVTAWDGVLEDKDELLESLPAPSVAELGNLLPEYVGEWFLEMYVKGRLEKSLMLDPGTLKRLFPIDSDFVSDLEKHWTLLANSYFKRVQCPPIPIFSKRAFGRDFEEFLGSQYFTLRFRDLAENLGHRIDSE